MIPSKDTNKNNLKKKNFYSMPEFDKWYENVENRESFAIDYYKGLGTSSSTEFKEYFSNLKRHKIPFAYSGEKCDNGITLAFSRERISDRKKWLDNYMQDAKRRQKLNKDALTIYNGARIDKMSYIDFINKDLVLFANENLRRTVASSIDGFKPGQRKVIWTCFKRNDKVKVKVAQLAGSVKGLKIFLGVLFLNFILFFFDIFQLFFTFLLEYFSEKFQFFNVFHQNIMRRVQCLYQDAQFSNNLPRYFEGTSIQKDNRNNTCLLNI
jgi:hypothetical protein